MRRPDRVTLIAGCAAVLLAVFAALAVRPSDDGGDSFAVDDVRAGGLAAFAEMLRREDVAVSRWELRTVELDRSVQRLVSVPRARQPLAPPPRGAAENDALAAWVRAGGQLVFAGDEGPPALHLPRTVTASDAAAGLRGPKAALVRVTRGWSHRFIARRGDRVWLRDAHGALWLSYRLGRGTITATPDAAPLTNARLGDGDNARLAYGIAVDAGFTQRIAFDEAIHGDIRDRPWWHAIGIPLRVALGIGAFVLALALAGGALRLGPPLPPPSPPEPTSAVFIAAVAALHERAHARVHAADVLARDAARRAARAAGSDERLDLPTLVQRLHGHRLAAAVDALARAAGAPDGDAKLSATARAAWAVRREVGREHGG